MLNLYSLLFKSTLNSNSLSFSLKKLYKLITDDDILLCFIFSKSSELFNLLNTKSPSSLYYTFGKIIPKPAL